MVVGSPDAYVRSITDEGEPGVADMWRMLGPTRNVHGGAQTQAMFFIRAAMSAFLLRHR